MDRFDAFMDKGKMLAENLRNLRRKKGYTQSQLAELSGVSRRIVVHYENYVRKPVYENVQKMADALGVSIDELIGKTESRKAKKQDDASYKIMKKVRIIEKLPLRDQNMIFNLITSLAKKNKLEGKL